MPRASLVSSREQVYAWERGKARGGGGGGGGGG